MSTHPILSDKVSKEDEEAYNNLIKYLSIITNSSFSEEDPQKYRSLNDFYKYISSHRDNRTHIMEGELCEKCGNKTAIKYNIQDRSLDEGASTYIRCLKCGLNRKIN